MLQNNKFSILYSNYFVGSKFSKVVIECILPLKISHSVLHYLLLPRRIHQLRSPSSAQSVGKLCCIMRSCHLSRVLHPTRSIKFVVALTFYHFHGRKVSSANSPRSPHLVPHHYRFLIRKQRHYCTHFGHQHQCEPQTSAVTF